MRQLYSRYGTISATLVLALVAFWIAALIVLPNAYMFEQSFRPFLPAAQIGSAEDVYTFKNYATVFSGEARRSFFGLMLPVHTFVLVQTISYSVLVTIVCLLMAYPVAYGISVRAPTSARPFLLMLLVTPLLVSDMLRTFAWYLILSYSGPLNVVSDFLGFGKFRWISGFSAINVTLIYGCAMFMVLPICNAIATLDKNLLEAAEDLGASRWRLHSDIILSHAKTGIASGCMIVFMGSAGTVVVPTLMASPNSRWFTQIIEQWISTSNDWNAASAYSFLLLAVCLVFVMLMMRLFRVRLDQATG